MAHKKGPLSKRPSPVEEGGGLELGLNLEEVNELVHAVERDVQNPSEEANRRLAETFDRIRGLDLVDLARSAKAGDNEARNASDRLVKVLQGALKKGQDEAKELLLQLGVEVPQDPECC